MGKNDIPAVADMGAASGSSGSATTGPSAGANGSYVTALEHLHEISLALSASFDAESGNQMLEQLAAAARQLLAMPMASVSILTDDGLHLDVVVEQGFDPPLPYDTWPLAEAPVARHCLEGRGEVLTFGDVEAPDVPPVIQVLRAQHGIRSLIMVPLKVEQRAIGILAIADRVTRDIGENDVRLLRLLGAQAAVIIANRRLYERVDGAVLAERRLVRRHASLLEISTAMQEAATRDEALQRLADLAPGVLEVDQCVIGLPVPPAPGAPCGTALRVAAATSGTVGEVPRGADVVIHCARCASVMRAGEVLVLADAKDDPEIPRGLFPNVGSALYVPLTDNASRSVGLMALMRRAPGQFTPEQIQTAQLLARPAGALIENLRLHDETRAALESQRALLRQREFLYTLNNDLYRAADIRAALQKITAEVAPVLGIDYCSIVLTVDGGCEEVEIVAASYPDSDRMLDRRFSIKGDRCSRTFATHAIEVIPDASADPTLHPAWREVNVQLGSLAYVPMFQGNGRPQGIFTIIRRAVGEFTRDQLELARVFAARVSDAIEHARLDDQTRRDAEAKAILLRELNHRVKNNLAGIVALLTLDEPADLTAGVRQWLDRVVDRVSTMSRTHDLFAGGTEHVGVGKLIEQALMSLSVVRPEGATVRTEMRSPAAAQVRLRTDRAVTLAMVLHELCYNALAHGVARRGDGAGAVTIVVARDDSTSPPRMSIEITDDGPGLSAPGDAGAPRDKDSRTSGGQGLVLVGGLVTRELHGQFSLRPAKDHGGATAAIEFPLFPEEIREVDE